MWLKSLQTFGQRLAADAAVALVLALVVGLVLASLSAAGITMTLAIVLLAVAWIVAMIGTFVMPKVWNPSHKHRTIFGFLFDSLLVGIGSFEYRAQPAQAQSTSPTPSMNVPSIQPPISYSQDCLPGAGCSQGQMGGQVVGTLNQFGPAHQPNAFYQNGQFIGLATSSVVDENSKVTILTNPRMAGGTIDFSSPFEFRDSNFHDYIVECPEIRPTSPNSAMVSISIAGNTKCRILK